VKQKQFSPRINTNLDRGKPFVFKANGTPLHAYPGETIAAALLAAGRRLFRKTAKSHHPRGFYCGMGVCWECTMIVDGRPNVRTCNTLAQPGMQVEIQTGLDLEAED